MTYNISLQSNETKVVGIPHSVFVIRNMFIPIWSLIIIFGFVGNVLTIKVLRFRRLRSTSTSLFLTALAVTDIFYVSFGILQMLIDTTFYFPGKIMRERSAIFCRLQPLLLYTLSYVSVWLLVAVTIDRMILVVFPVAAKRLSNKRNASIVIACVIAFFTSLDLHFIGTMRYSNVTCTFIGSKFAQVFTFFDLTVTGILPCFLMILCNIAIILKLRKLRAIREKKLKKGPEVSLIPGPSGATNNAISTGNKRKDKTSSLTRMLLSINIFFIASIIPQLVFNFVYFLCNLEAKWQEDQEFWGGRLYALEKTVCTIWFLNFCIHFLLYCLSGPNFREAAKIVLRISSPTSNSQTNQTPIS